MKQSHKRFFSFAAILYKLSKRNKCTNSRIMCWVFAANLLGFSIEFSRSFPLGLHYLWIGDKKSHLTVLLPFIKQHFWTHSVWKYQMFLSAVHKVAFKLRSPKRSRSLWEKCLLWTLRWQTLSLHIALLFTLMTMEC